MAQVSSSTYLALTDEQDPTRSDGLYQERSTNDIVMISNGSVAGRWSASSGAMAMSGDVTITGAGVTSIGTGKVLSAMLDPKTIQYGTLTFGSAAVIASNSTALQLVADTAVGAANICVFEGATLNITGGTANYDTNQNFIVKIAGDGSGAAVSTTVANFLNAGAAGKLGTIKMITTDYTPVAGKGMALTSSATPKTSAGDRQLIVQYWYSIIPISLT